MRSGYDFIAPFYDRLSKFVFGTAIKDSQKFLIRHIGDQTKILIIGGGTGWIIEEISARHKSGLQITYVDASRKMIDIAETRYAGNNNIEFIQKSVFEVQFNSRFDVIITPFFLDNFSEKNINVILDKLNNCLAKNGLWLHADFQIYKNNLWQKILLKIMYLFFKIICNIETGKLVETKAAFRERGFKILTTKNFYSDFICPIVYLKA